MFFLVLQTFLLMNGVRDEFDKLIKRAQLAYFD